MTEIVSTTQELADRISDGVLLALPPDGAGCAMQVILALIDKQIQQLRLIGLPQLGLAADMLIGAGCVASVESAAVTLGELGVAPCFARAVAAGKVRLRDSTCPMIHAGLQAGEKGVPFIPVRGVLGSDLVTHRSDWKIIDNPYSDNDPLLLAPAIKPDVTLFHSALADQFGNVWIGRRRELMVSAHASSKTYVTVERICDGSLLDDPLRAPGTLPNLYVTAVARAAGGARPLGLDGEYEADAHELERYKSMTRSEDGLNRYLRGR